jgi:hypothetical protein
MRLRRSALGLLGALTTVGALGPLGAPPAAAAQGMLTVRPAQPSRVFAGVGGLVAAPQGEFDRYVGVGYGLDGGLLVKLAPGGVLALRVDGGFVQYGHERKRSCLVDCRIAVDVNTSNDIFVFGIGPQLMLPDGRVRPYLTATAGVAYFLTHSSLSEANDGGGFANTNNFDDATFAWTAGGGLYVPVRRGFRPISIEAGVRYHANGEARYLREGSIVDNPDGSISFTPIRSQTNLLLFHLGVTFGL